MVNLVGIQESVYDILGYHPENNGHNVIKKVIQTAVDIINEKSKENQGNAEIRITMLKDDSTFRFKDLDIEKYGKSLTINNDKNMNYSQGLIIDGEKIVSNSLDLDPIIEYYSSVEDLLKGGVSIDLDITNVSNIDDVKKVIKSSANLPFFYLAQNFSICNICGERFFIADLKICEEM